jgi:phosphatidylserine decarboxylase
MPEPVRYRNRCTGALETEQIPSEAMLRWLYHSFSGACCRVGLCHCRLGSRLIGWSQNRAFSRGRIAAFAQAFGIDPDEAELPLAHYPSFNAFFSRRLRADARPFDPDPDTLCSPADGKVLVFPQVQPPAAVPVKGAAVEPTSLLSEAAAAAPFAGGACLVVRLAPPDYHRFHFPAAGTAGPSRRVRGQYHSVNPIALARVAGVLSRNVRTVTRLDLDRFGAVAYVEVGALAVGSIVQTSHPGPVRRGQEKGYFQFGGSTLVLLFRAGSVTFDDDLVRDSAQGLENQVRAGMRLGRAAASAEGAPGSGDRL